MYMYWVAELYNPAVSYVWGRVAGDVQVEFHTAHCTPCVTPYISLYIYVWDLIAGEVQLESQEDLRCPHSTSRGNWSREAIYVALRCSVTVTTTMVNISNADLRL